MHNQMFRPPPSALGPFLSAPALRSPPSAPSSLLFLSDLRPPTSALTFPQLPALRSKLPAPPCRLQSSALRLQFLCCPPTSDVRPRFPSALRSPLQAPRSSLPPSLFPRSPLPALRSSLRFPIPLNQKAEKTFVDPTSKFGDNVACQLTALPPFEPGHFRGNPWYGANLNICPEYLLKNQTTAPGMVSKSEHVDAMHINSSFFKLIAGGNRALVSSVLVGRCRGSHNQPVFRQTKLNQFIPREHCIRPAFVPFPKPL